LTGTVSSEAEGWMEGVLVSAKMEGGTIFESTKMETHGSPC
jgi:hypothetical protein